MFMQTEDSIHASTECVFLQTHYMYNKFSLPLSLSRSLSPSLSLSCSLSLSLFLATLSESMQLMGFVDPGPGPR